MAGAESDSTEPTAVISRTEPDHTAVIGFAFQALSIPQHPHALDEATAGLSSAIVNCC
jgi:hypothetical protein